MKGSDHWLECPADAETVPFDNPLAAFLAVAHGLAEIIGEWAFYAAVVLIALALVQKFPYRLFYKTHRVLAALFVLLAFHAVILFDIEYWAMPVGWAVIVLAGSGLWASVIALSRKIGANRRVTGTLSSLHYFRGVKSLEMEIDVAHGWPGHLPGQFVFVTTETSEGAHPYTIASDWNGTTRNIKIIAKELGDYTNHLGEKLKIGQSIRIEGPYGCFNFDDGCSRQIWIGAGIGITPFIAQMKHRAAQNSADCINRPRVDLFHCTADIDDEALDKLVADAKSADVRIHILIDALDGLLSGARIREIVPEWREAGLWFCGPAGFGNVLRTDFSANGFPIEQRFHQELFAMR